MPLQAPSGSRVLDTVIIGAGISGIGAAYYLKRDCPGKSFTVLEARADLGGTWDLFKYPGIRSDSDLYTFAYDFKPWRSDKSIASADLILEYINETVDEFQIREHIQFNTQVTEAHWSTEEACWTLTIRHSHTGERQHLKTRWIFSATGYYDYEQGYTPTFPGADTFEGDIIHPQHWPDNFTVRDRHIVVIGSGATAITLVPELAKEAARVTLLQRTPTFMMNLPTGDPVATLIKKVFSEARAHALIRKKNYFLHRRFWQFCQRFPKTARRILLHHVKSQLPKGYDVKKHFNPPYNPWDQRLCAVTDGDLFQAISSGRAEVVTDHIDCFTEKGIRLRSGQLLQADTVVTATGLNIKLMGSIDLSIDGTPVNIPQTVAYKGSMLSGVPNFCFAVGYTNATWTLKIGLLCEYFCRVLNHMDEQGYTICKPEIPDGDFETSPLLDFGAGYIQRSLDRMPKKGASSPWEVPMDYYPDMKIFREGRIDDGCLKLA
jgi:cation diffusion facilitator CzcD-associated flavoprotein CzcO